MKRVLVIGGGHNGLVAAIQLAGHGLEVTVLEHAARPGGATASGELTLPGFIHDHCAAFAPLAAASPAIRELSLEREGLDWITPQRAMAHPFADGSAIVLDRGVAATASSLGAAGAGWEAAMARMLPLADPLAEAVLSPLPPLRAGVRVAGALRGDLLPWGRRLLGSVEALGLELFAGDRRATAWLAASAQHTGLPPSTRGSGMFGFLLQLLGHRHGWPLPRGGMGELAAALVRRATRDGATLRCEATVERLIVRRGRIAAVGLAGGEELPADAVIATITAGALVRMLPPGAMPERIVRRLRRWRYATGVFKLDYALSASVPWTAAQARDAGVVHVAGELEELTRAAQQGARGEVPARPALVVGQQSLHDPARAPAGRHTLYAYAHVPARSAIADERVADLLEQQLERFAPGFRDLILARCARSPRELERENPSLVGGDLGGGSFELDQLLVLRPTPRMCRYRTPLPGLFVAGASIHPGGAVHGVSGRGAARALLREAGLAGGGPAGAPLRSGR